MKQTVILALLASVSAFRPNASQSPWAAKPEDAPAPTKIDGAFTIHDDGSSYYNRAVPDHFSAESDDRLMNSLISKYSVEGNSNGEPNGHFFVTKRNALAAANEVVHTHLKFHGDKREGFVGKRFNKIWDHFDVLNEGFLDAAKMPQVLRMVLGEVEISDGLQVQLEESGAISQKAHRRQHKLRDALMLQYRPNAVLSPWAAKPEDAPPRTAITDAYTPVSHKKEFYDRQVPDIFTAESDDRLMNSLISKYAVEGRDNGHPNGKFFLTPSGMRAVSEEVVHTHFKFDGAKTSSYVDERFQKLWDHMDVNHDGFLDVAKGPVFLRSLVGEVETNLSLQVQMNSQNLVQRI